MWNAAKRPPNWSHIFVPGCTQILGSFRHVAVCACLHKHRNSHVWAKWDIPGSRLEFAGVGWEEKCLIFFDFLNIFLLLHSCFFCMACCKWASLCLNGMGDAIDVVVGAMAAAAGQAGVFCFSMWPSMQPVIIPPDSHPAELLH